jgi:hypothetical protein
LASNAPTVKMSGNLSGSSSTSSSDYYKGLNSSGFGKWLKRGAIVFAMLLIIIMVYTWGFRLGLGQEALAQASTQAQKGGLFGAVSEGAVKTYNAIFNPEALTTNYGFESDVQQNANNPDLGVKIRDFKQIGKTFTNEPISLSGLISVSGFDQPVELATFCSLNANSGEYVADNLIPAKLSGISSAENKATFYPNTNIIIGADCYFPNGIKEVKESLLGKDQAIITKQAKLYTNFNFVTKASIKIYMLGWSEFEQILKDPKINDPFAYYKINEPQRLSDGTVKSTSTQGPINLGLGTYISQPFSEDKEYPFGVTISPSSILASGDLEKLENLEIMVPNYVYLQGDSEYGSSFDSSQCAFENTGLNDEDNFKIYKLKEELKNKLNNECKDESLKSSKLTKQDCYDLHWKRLEFRCRFKIVKSEPIKTMEFDYIRAIAKYVFRTDMPATVSVYRMPDTALVDTSPKLV